MRTTTVFLLICGHQITTYRSLYNNARNQGTSRGYKLLLSSEKVGSKEPWRPENVWRIAASLQLIPISSNKGEQSQSQNWTMLHPAGWHTLRRPEDCADIIQSCIGPQSHRLAYKFYDTLHKSSSLLIISYIRPAGSQYLVILRVVKLSKFSFYLSQAWFRLRATSP